MGYNPGQPTQIQNTEELRQYLDDELSHLSKALNEQDIVALTPLGKEPSRLRDGLVVYADSSGWDPGFGSGPYVRKDSTWVPLGGSWAMAIGARADVPSLLIGSGVSAIRTSGYYTVGDGGGALYKRVVSEPTHEGKVESANGVWFEYVLESLCNVKQFGATGNIFFVDDTAACQNAADYLVAAHGGGLLFFPPGNYPLISGFAPVGSIRIVGSGVNATFLWAQSGGTFTDVTVVNQSGAWCSIEHLTIFGKGTPAADSGSFGATVPAFITTGHVFQVRIWGGSNCMESNATDVQIQNMDCSAAYGTALVVCSGQNWWIRDKFDHYTTGLTAAQVDLIASAANWVASHVYAAGNVAIIAGYYVVCTVGGTSGGGSAPALQNYGTPFTDNTVTWLLLAPGGLAPLRLVEPSGENHFLQCDGAGEGLSYPYHIDAAFAIVNMTDCVTTVYIEHAFSVLIEQASLGSDLTVANPIGNLIISSCKAFAPVNILIAANQQDFIITHNNLFGGGINIPVGTSDHYVIDGNIHTSITDGGTGTHKIVNAVP